ncbi:MAG: hypothetical protein KKA67_07885 [Spirochaetes bacterium]|nr:hypothetical protein [Spirochaetota bacterium]MBU1082130.1 hypothetical protein [Spirochaetota bacterium]
MRRTYRYFALAGVELARYFAIVYAAGPFIAVLTSGTQVIRLVAAPNVVFAVAFFFLGVDRERYAAYRPLIVVCKAVALFSSVIALPRLFGLGGSEPSKPAAYAVLAIAAWDAISAAIVLLSREEPPVARGLADGEPERVELE